jgi:MFS family permease
MLTRHPLFQFLRDLRGNPRPVILTEFMYGVPVNLYLPYASVYMLALGLNDAQIGLITSINLAVQILGGLLGGPITDKLGRRKTTAIFDFLTWVIPAALWAAAQDFRYFAAAAIFNGCLRVVQTSWTLLLVEDADPEQLVDIYSWIYIAALVTAFITPISGLLIGKFSLVPTMRGLFLFMGAAMFIKCILLYFLSAETGQGKIRLEETRHQSLFSLFHGYGGVVRQMLRAPQTLYTLGMMVVMYLANTLNTTFWSILVTQKLHIPTEWVSVYPFARSIMMLLFFFIAMPVIKEMKFRNPMMVGFLMLAASQLILILQPEKSYLLLLLSTLIEACAYATVSTQIDRLAVVTVDEQERARITALMAMVVLAVSTPFGWIGGRLSEINRTYPFMINLCLYAIGVVLVFLAARQHARDEAVGAVEAI